MSSTVFWHTSVWDSSRQKQILQICYISWKMILFLLFTLAPKCCKTPFTLFLFLCIFFIFSTFCACSSFFFLWQKNVKKLKRMISTSEHRVKDPFASQNTQQWEPPCKPFSGKIFLFSICQIELKWYSNKNKKLWRFWSFSAKDFGRWYWPLGRAVD